MLAYTKRNKTIYKYNLLEEIAFDCTLTKNLMKSPNLEQIDYLTIVINSRLHIMIIYARKEIESV